MRRRRRHDRPRRIGRECDGSQVALDARRASDRHRWRVAAFPGDRDEHWGLGDRRHHASGSAAGGVGGRQKVRDGRTVYRVAGAGQSKTITLPVVAKRSGKQEIQATAVADGNLTAPPRDAIVEIKEAQLALTTHGPSKGYIGEEVTWQLVVRNNGDVPMERISVRASLPPEVTFVKATDGGKLSGRQVVWELGTAPAQQERTVAVTVACDKPTGKTTMSATVVGVPPQIAMG